MLRTLQAYVARELFKTFALSAIGLTLTFSLCGGIMNMIQAEDLSSMQMINILGLVIPVALTLTLPVSALFACAIVYGRLASDNETDACKASGINIHRLLWPAVWLSVFTGLFTFTFANFLIPTFIEKIDVMVRKDLEKIVIHALGMHGYVRRGPYVLYAREAQQPEPGSDQKMIEIRNAAFIELEKDSLSKCGTAEAVRVDFMNKSETGRPAVAASLFGVRGLDVQHNHFYHQDAQPIQSVEIPTMVRDDLKWLTLPRLFYYRGNLPQLPKVKGHLQAMHLLIREASMYKYVIDQLQGPTKTLNLVDGDRQLEIRAAKAVHHADDFRPELTKVTIIEKYPGFQREYKADRCSIRYKKGFAEVPEKMQITVRGNAGFIDSRSPKVPVERKDIDLDDISVPPQAVAEADAVSDETILGFSNKIDLGALLKQAPEPLPFGERIEDERVHERKDVVKYSLEIDGIIHSRVAFSASVFVMLVLAAGLGIIFRGGQMLTAFVISFVPGLFVVVMNIMGRQLSENLGTHLFGIVMIWLGIGLIAIADAVVLTRYLRR